MEPRGQIPEPLSANRIPLQRLHGAAGRSHLQTLGSSLAALLRLRHRRRDSRRRISEFAAMPPAENLRCRRLAEIPLRGSALLVIRPSARVQIRIDGNTEKQFRTRLKKLDRETVLSQAL